MTLSIDLQKGKYGNILQKEGVFLSKYPKAEDFREEIQQRINNARRLGQEYVDIISGDVHKKLGGYPGQNHRMPTCCMVMYSLMKPTDKVLSKPSKGKGASLKIRYFT